MGLVIRTPGDPAAVASAVRARLREVDPAVPLYDIATMERRAARSVADRTFVLALLGAFALVAIVLAAVGIYGVVAEVGNQRRRELSLRLALGATPGASCASWSLPAGSSP